MDASEEETAPATSISLKMMLSRSYASKEEFVREYKIICCEKSKCKQFYLLVSIELKKAIVEDDIESVKKLSTLIEYTSDLDEEITWRDCYVDTGNPIRSTNLIILSCKHNRVEILEYLLDSGSKVLNNLSVNSISPKDEDEAHHNVFYYAIRSENIQLLITVINKWLHLEELEEILSKVYKELKLKNIPLSIEMQVFVERKLIDLCFFSTDEDSRCPKTDDPDKLLLKKRIELLLQSISLLKRDYSNTRKVDGRFLFIATFIAQNIHLLKGRLKSHYNRIPWEELEFCLVTFVSSQTKLQELNIFFRAILNKRKILDYLENLANELSDIEKITQGDKLHCSLRGAENTREKIVAKIIEANPQFEELYNDYHQIRDIYSLRRIGDHIKLAISADVQEKQGQLVIVRVLQVLGEHLKSTLESPKLSQNTQTLLELSLPQKAKKIITELRDSISHADTLSQILEIEKNADVNFFINIQNDIKKVSEVVTDILYENRIKTFRILLKKIQDSETLDEINEVLEELSTARFDKTIKKNFKTIEHEKIEKLIKELSDNITDKTNYENELFKKLNNIISSSDNEIETIRSDYVVEFIKLRSYSAELNFNKNSRSKTSDREDQNLIIRKIKTDANYRLNKVTPTIKLNFEEIVKLTKEIFRCVKSRMPSNKIDEVQRLTRKVFYIVEFETGDIKWIEELREQLPKRKKKNIKLTPEDLQLKLEQLDIILSKNLLKNFMDDKKLQTELKMLVLDIMVILDFEGYLKHNNLFLDVNTPLLHGRCLRNYLAHDNAVVDILLSDPLLAIILNAEKLIKENITQSKKKIGKLVSDDPVKLEKNFMQDLDNITNQERLFVALEEGDSDVLWDCLKKGADIKARSTINSWTTLHFAAKGSSLEIIKFILAQSLKVDVKDNSGQTPLHIAAAHGRQDIVEFFLKQKSTCVDDPDIRDITPLHVAAEKGHKSIVEVLLKNKANISTEDEGGFTPLYYAIRNNCVDVVKFLLESDLNFDINEAMYGSTALHLAASDGYLELVTILLRNGAHINATTDSKLVPLHLATFNGHLEVVNILILKGATVNTSDLYDFTPLHCAIFADNVEMVKSLLKHGAYVKTAAATPLHLAAECGNLEIVAVLLEYDADIHAKFNNNTVLYHAARDGHKEIVELLISKGAKVNAKCENNLSALHGAVTNGHKDVAYLLIAKEAEVNAQCDLGATAMHIAATIGNIDIIDLLIKNKAKVNAKRLNGVTPLHEAVKESREAAVEFLIENEAEVNVRNNDGLTPLYVAVLLGNQTIVKLLIDNGAQVNVGIIGDSTPPPLHTASMAGHKEILEILIENGAIIDDIKSYKMTPLHCAIEYNQKEIVELLLKKGAKVDLENFADWSIPVVRGYTDIVNILLKSNKQYATLKVSKNYTLLHLAAKMGHKKIVNALITNGAVVDAMSEDNVTPLLCAAEEGFAELVDILIARGAEVNLIYSQDNTPLDVAAKKGHCKVVKVLLDNTPDIDIKNDNRSDAPIRLAVAGGHLEVVKILLPFMENNINVKDTDGFTLLQLASNTKNNLELVKFLVDEGSDINAEVDGYKAIHLAARNGYKDTVEFFVSKGLSIDEPSAIKYTLLHCAATEGQLEIVNYLIDQHADVNAKATNGFTPVHVAALHGHVDVIEVLLKNGATFNAIDNVHRKPLELANNKDVIKLLKSTEKLFTAVQINSSSKVQSYIESGAIVNVKSAEDETPLHYAALKGYYEIVNILLQNKANPNVLSLKGFTPLHYATKFSHLKVVKVLLSYYAVYNAVSDSGETPFDLAVDNNIISLLKLISDSFENIEIDNCQVINDLDKIKDIETIKAIMCARNKNNRTLVVAALHSEFSKIKELQEIAQGDISDQIRNATDLIVQQEYQKALCILEAALHKKREILGPNDLGTFHIQKFIIDILVKQGDYKEALKTAEEILQKEKEILGLNNNITLKTRTIIASIMFNQGKDEEAFSMFQEIYQKEKRILGAKNTDTLMIQTCMGQALERQNKYEEALGVFRSVYRNTDPANYQDSLNAQQNIAMVLANQGKDEEALKMFNEILEKMKVILGSNHLSTMTVLFNIAVITGKKKKYNKALTMYYEILDNQKKVLKPNHPTILRTQYNIACTLFFQRKWIHSLKAFQEGFHERKAIFGSNHPIVLDIINNIKAINLNLKLQGKMPSKILQFLQKDFIVAAGAGDIKTIKSLLEDGADVNNKDINGRTALHYAVSNGYVDVVKILLKHGADITQVTTKGNTPLHIATSKNYKKIVEILLQHLGPDKLNDYINAKTTGSGASSLHVSAKNGFLDITLLLLERGAIYNITNNEDKTPLDLCNDENVINLLKLIDGLFEEAKSGNEETIPKLKEVKPEYVEAVENATNTENGTILQVIIINKFKIVAAKHLGMLHGSPDMTIPLTLKIIDKR